MVAVLVECQGRCAITVVGVPFGVGGREGAAERSQAAGVRLGVDREYVVC
jgi:hypothetical protein